MVIVQGGYTAGKNGKVMEEQIKQVLVSSGYIELTPEEKKLLVRLDGAPPIGEDKWFCQQVRLYRNLYGSNYTADFYLFDKDKFPLGLSIESKWQASSGSVDEKYCFTVMSLKSMPGEQLLILDGGGARQGAVQWIKKQKTKRFMFFNLVEFIVWANGNLR